MILALCLLSVILILIVIYIITSLVFVNKIKKQLQNASLENFKSILNSNYQFRYLLDGAVRYKWYKKFAVIKADFNQAGSLQNLVILPLNIFRYFIKAYFQSNNHAI